MPLAEWTPRSAKFDSSLAEAALPASGAPAAGPTISLKCRGHVLEKALGTKKQRKGVEPLAQKVDKLALEFTQI